MFFGIRWGLSHGQAEVWQMVTTTLLQALSELAVSELAIAAKMKPDVK